jgi:uncharacterized membrane protein YciS (DUF1049 family)
MPKIKLNDGTEHKLGGGSYLVAYIVAAMIFLVGMSVGWAICAWFKYGCTV